MFFMPQKLAFVSWSDLDTGNLSKTLARYQPAIPASSLFLDTPPPAATSEAAIGLIAADQLLANVTICRWIRRSEITR